MKKNRSPIYRKPLFIDGIDINNIHCYTYKEMLEAEAKNHNADIQFAIYRYLDHNYWRCAAFDAEAKKEYLKNKKFHDEKIAEKYQAYLREDPDEKYSSVKKNYIHHIAYEISNKASEVWLKKAFSQNHSEALFVYAEREITKIKENNTGDINKALSLLERALKLGSTKAAEELIILYLNGKYGIPQNEKRADEIKSMYDPKDYKFYLSEDKTYCSITKINKILLNNTELCNHMVDLYHKMALLKEKLDALIKEGKSYYKDYKIIGEISFFIDNPIEIEGMKTYDNATCDWKLVFDEKPVPEIVEALDFWENHNKNDLYFPQSFICRATHDFIYPKKKLLNINCNYIPYEVFENASSKNFYHNITLLIAKYPVPVKQLNKNPEEYLRYSNYYRERNLHRNLFWFEKKKILKIARRMLEYEFEINSTGNKIKKELEEFSKTTFPDKDEFFFEQRLNYKFCHPFGIITKKDAMYSKYVDSMLNIS